MSVERASNGVVIHPAVVALGQDTVRIRQAIERRPLLVVDALLGGAMPQQVADAAGLTLDELRVAVGRWATKQRDAGQLSPKAHTDLLNTVFGQASW